jgi:hypothetical protein
LGTGCIKPTWDERIIFSLMAMAARLANGSTHGLIKSVGVGVGGSLAGMSAPGVIGQASVSYLDIVDAEGNAERYSAIGLTPGSAGWGGGGIVGVQVMGSVQPVPKTAQGTLSGSPLDMTVLSGGVAAGPGASVDTTVSGSATVTVGGGFGGKAVLGGVFIIWGATPYCGTGGGI